MKKYSISLPFTLNDVMKINSLATNEKIVIVFKNTREINPDLLSKLNSNVLISITGGLDPSKNKFNNEHYQKRTYYSPCELKSIIEVYKNIERSINPLWNDLEKMMFVYKTICEYSYYSECTYNNRDAARNLLGMITGKSVCSGYALIFKEAMDRLGIECFYQNRESHHSWNIVKIDNKYHAVELTWDTYNKKNNRCGFCYFCREDKNTFYSNKHHNILYENEEKEFEIEKISDEVLKSTYEKISKERVKKESTRIENNEEVAYIGNNKIIIRNGVPILSNQSTCTYIRKDGTSFLVCPTGNHNDLINEYVYIEYRKEIRSIKLTRIYSEMNLISDDLSLREKIANSLLSKERVANKINNYNGYVGYVLPNSKDKYCNSLVEHSLNIQR